MTNLNEYLRHKRAAHTALRARTAQPDFGPSRLRAVVTAEGRSGVRRIRIRDHQVLSDSPANYVGYDLGPTSPELALGVLGSCLTHSYLIRAAVLGIPVDQLEVEVTGQIDSRSGDVGFDGVPREPHDIAYIVHLSTPASDADVAALRDAVDRLCPILNLLLRPQNIAGSIKLTRPTATEPAELSPEGVA